MKKYLSMILAIACILFMISGLFVREIHAENIDFSETSFPIRYSDGEALISGSSDTNSTYHITFRNEDSSEWRELEIYNSEIEIPFIGENVSFASVGEDFVFSALCSLNSAGLGKQYIADFLYWIDGNTLEVKDFALHIYDCDLTDALSVELYAEGDLIHEVVWNRNSGKATIYDFTETDGHVNEISSKTIGIAEAETLADLFKVPETIEENEYQTIETVSAESFTEAEETEEVATTSGEKEERASAETTCEATVASDTDLDETEESTLQSDETSETEDFGEVSIEETLENSSTEPSIEMIES